MTLLANAPPFLLQDSAARLRAKQRLYVVFQVLGWGAMLVLQIVVIHFLTAQQPQAHALVASIQIVATGLLLTHVARYQMERWSWKNLGWQRLVPRVMAIAAVLGVIWALSCFLLQRFLLGWRPSKPVNLTFLIAWQWLNCALIFAGWIGLYFFYHLFDRFNRLEVERLRISTTAKHAELRALKSQLNPHFIFNSLNSLRALIEEDPKRARQSVTQLANLLRYSLQSVQRETVPFEEELKVVTDYLSLEQVRHEERLRWRLDVPSEALHWPIPPLLLQTLVENAVKYGISARAEGGEISVVARCGPDIMTLRVTNPGLLSPASLTNPSTGLGLANASERLRLLFGEKSSLKVHADGSDSVVAEAIIPLQGWKNRDDDDDSH